LSLLTHSLRSTSAYMVLFHNGDISTDSSTGPYPTNDISLKSDTYHNPPDNISYHSISTAHTHSDDTKSIDT
jgi:hypothetical protein